MTSKPKKILKKGKRTISMYPKKNHSYSYEEDDIIEFQKEVIYSSDGPRRSGRIMQKRVVSKMREELSRSYEEIEDSSDNESDSSIIYDEFEDKESSHQKPVIMFTGFDNKNYQQYQKDLEKLGAIIEHEDILNVTHLISNGLKRTSKLLSAICVSTPYILSLEWVKKSIRHKKLIYEDDYFINDKHSDFSLKESLKRSSEKKIFKDLKFYITPNILPSKSMIMKVIQYGGGEIVETINSRGNIYVISCQEDEKLCKEILNVEKDHFFNVEFIVQSILHQELQYKNLLF